jgi:predicted acylesterase/phospholipase RssA
LVAIIVLSTALAGCITLPRVSFTAAEQAAASPAGFNHIRYAPEDVVLGQMLNETLKSNSQGDMDVLAISGGGANGAYGAGLLYGWTKGGERPEFQLVTGVSTGALSAPFAFLGSAWDEQLSRAYLGPRINHVLRGRGLLALFTPGLYSKGPLEGLVRGYVTDDMLQAVAAEQAKGRRLLVATTDLDTEQLMVWDMGAIAAHGGPEARELFVQVLVASASVPGIFAPSMIAVRSDGRRFTEMHVDGQAASAFFAIPQTLLTTRPATDRPYRPHLFIIINGQLNSPFAVTPRATIPILTRTIDAANKASIHSLVTNTLDFCHRNGCELRIAALPVTEKDDPLDFSAGHIQSLFSAGQTAIGDGTAWMKAAPAIAPVKSAPAMVPVKPPPAPSADRPG